MKKMIRIIVPLTMLALLLQACFRPRTEDDQQLETAATLQAEANLSDLDACVSGLWKMDVYALQSKFMYLGVTPNMVVIAPSELTMEFRDDNTFALFGMITMRMDIPSTSDYIELNGVHSASGTYEADGRIITFAGVVHDVQYGTMRAYINGEWQDGLFTSSEDGAPSTIAAPVFEFPASADYDCSESDLTLQYSGVTEEWLRSAP
jgi:hypothetical protein